MAVPGASERYARGSGPAVRTLWRWSAAKDVWEYATQASPEHCRAVLRGYKRRDAKGVRWRWADDGVKPRKFRTRNKLC